MGDGGFMEPLLEIAIEKAKAKNVCSEQKSDIMSVL